MPQGNGGAAPVEPLGPYVQFEEGMSEEEVRHTMASLLTLSRCFSILMQRLEEIEAAELPQSDKEIEALRLATEFFMVCDRPARKVITNLFNPLLSRLIDELVRARSVRADGVRQKPAGYVQTNSIWKADCAAAADVLICSGKSHDDTKAWLRSGLARHGLSVPAERVIDWRDEVVERKNRPTSGPLDIMAAVFDERRPTGPDGKRERFSQAEAERLADEWLRDARLNIPADFEDPPLNIGTFP